MQTSAGTLVLRVAPNSNDMLQVASTALLGGTLQVTFGSGSYVTKQYDMVQSAGLGGTTFGVFTTTNLPANFTASLNYTSTNVLLNLTAILGQAPAPSPSDPTSVVASGLSVNQQNVATSLNNFFNSGGALPPNFVNMFGLTGSNLERTDAIGW